MLSVAGYTRVTDHRGMAESDLLRRHRAVLPEWLALYYDDPIEIVSGSGRHVTDGQGRTYLDFFAGILTNAIGYDIPEISDAIRAQVDTGVLHTSTLYLIRRQVELAERMAELSSIPDAKVFFTNSGTEANEAALLLASQYRNSNQVLALRNSYHGRAFATTGVTGNRGWSASSLSPLKVSYVYGGYRYRDAFANCSDEEYVDACVADLRDVLTTTTAGDVAALIAEPIQGVGGFNVPPDGMFGAFKEVLDEHGILLISDEVQTGWGRTGEHFWGIDAHGVTPDIMTFAKGVGNGLAMGGVIARADVMDCLDAKSISTFGGNPLAAAGAKATLDYLVSNELQTNAAKLGDRVLAGLRDIAGRHPLVGDVRGKGLMIGVELVRPDGSPDAAAATRAMAETKSRGLLIGKGGLYGNVLRLAPPMTLTGEEADQAVAILGESLEQTDNGR